MLGPLPLAHYYFCGSYRDSKQKILHCDIREVIAIHDIIVILHRPNGMHTYQYLRGVKMFSTKQEEI